MRLAPEGARLSWHSPSIFVVDLSPATSKQSVGDTCQIWKCGCRVERVKEGDGLFVIVQGQCLTGWHLDRNQPNPALPLTSRGRNMYSYWCIVGGGLSEG